MKKTALIVVLVFGLALTAGCAGAPILKEGSQTFGGIIVGDVAFSEKIECGQAENLESCKFVGIRNDEFSKEVSATFRGVFVQKLRDNGAFNVIKIPLIEIKFQMAYDERPSQVAEDRLLQARVSVFRGRALIFEKQQRVSSTIIFKAIVAGGPEVLAKRFADALGDYFANEVASVLREKTS